MRTQATIWSIQQFISDARTLRIRAIWRQPMKELVGELDSISDLFVRHWPTMRTCACVRDCMCVFVCMRAWVRLCGVLDDFGWSDMDAPENLSVLWEEGAPHLCHQRRLRCPVWAPQQPECSNVGRVDLFPRSTDAIGAFA